MALTFTGERFLPNCQGEMVYEHWHRYIFARDYVAGKRVLDVASGEGYGSALLAQSARSVTGVDISPDAVAHARQIYGSVPNLNYLCGSCTKIPLPAASFDVIVSFETIEHIVDHDGFLTEIQRLLAPGGMLIISSPNRIEYTEKTGYRNEFHVKELDGPGLRSLLDGRLPAQRWFAQRPCFQSMIWPIDDEIKTSRVVSIDGASGYPDELYFVVCCARADEDIASVIPSLTLLADRDHSVSREWSRTYAENRALRQTQDILKAEIESLRQAMPATCLTGLKAAVRRALGFRK
jgi:SAM-dependent methyltransferase